MINRKPSSLPFDHAIPAIPKVNEPAISDTILSEYVTRCITIRFALVIGGRSIIRSDKCGRPGPESDAIGRSSFSTVCSVTEKRSSSSRQLPTSIIAQSRALPLAITPLRANGMQGASDAADDEEEGVFPMQYSLCNYISR